jgi:hypothetical protein
LLGATSISNTDGVALGSLPKAQFTEDDSPDLLEPIEEPDAPAEGDLVRANEGEPEREPTNSE